MMDNLKSPGRLGKFYEIVLLPHHILELEKSLSRGFLNSTEPLWLAAFSAYNMEHSLKLSVEFESSYNTVLEFLKRKLS